MRQARVGKPAGSGKGGGAVVGVNDDNGDGRRGKSGQQRVGGSGLRVSRARSHRALQVTSDGHQSRRPRGGRPLCTGCPSRWSGSAARRSQCQARVARPRRLWSPRAMPTPRTQPRAAPPSPPPPTAAVAAATPCKQQGTDPDWYGAGTRPRHPEGGRARRAASVGGRAAGRAGGGRGRVRWWRRRQRRQRWP